jgi:hypothetical protein
MTQQMSTAVGGAQGGQSGAQIQIHPHADRRWAERTPAEPALSAAWDASVRVRAPAADADEVRLYAPYDALLVYRAGVLRTVLNNDGRLECPGLGACTACGNVVDPVSGESCRWCGAETQTEGHGRVAITRGESQ